MSAQNHIDLLGKKATDKVTGFTGVVSSVSFDLYGCIQAAITPLLDKDGKLVDGRWFDVNQLAVFDDARCMPLPKYTPHVAQFGSTPQQHAHGPAEKPAPK